MRSLGGLLAGAVAGAVVGLVSGAAAVLVHSSWWWLALGVATAVTMLRWLPTAPRVGFALGWGVAVARGSLARPEGDYLVSADAPGWTLIAASLVLVTGTLVSALMRAVLRAGRTGDQGVPGKPS